MISAFVSWISGVWSVKRWRPSWRRPYLKVRAWTANPWCVASASVVVESTPPLNRTTAVGVSGMVALHSMIEWL